MGVSCSFVAGVKFDDNFNFTMDNLSADGIFRKPTLDKERERLVPVIKEFRHSVDALIQRVTQTSMQESPAGSLNGSYAFFEREQVRTKLIEAKMWRARCSKLWVIHSQ